MESNAGCLMLDIGCWMLDTRYWMQETGYKNAGHWILITDY